MNVYSITFQTVLHAFQHRWKRILASVLVFALLGAAAGFLFRNRGMAEAGGGVQPLTPVDFAQVPRTRDYYTDCLRLLADTATNLDLYFSSLTANTMLDPERQAALSALSREAAVLQSSRIKPLRSSLEEAGAIFAPEEYLDGMADRYARELASLRMDLIAAEAATETIRQMDAPDYDGGFSSSYNTLLSLASQYPTMLRSQAVTEKYLDDLINHMPEIRTECQRVERELDSASKELNALLDRFTPLADEIAKEAGLSFALTVNDTGKTEILLTHAHRASSGGEVLAVMVVFFVLAGFCAGMFLAVCQEAKTARKADSAAPQKRP